MFFTPATYWHDLSEERFRAGSTFLAVINNENTINLDYVRNLQSLRKFIMVKYEEDIGIVPNESTWFGYYDREAKTIVMEETELYKSDKLGLKAMQQAGKLVFLLSPSGHLSLDEAWFISNIVPVLRET
jgi:palmitoyl-protein thioesterase